MTATEFPQKSPPDSPTSESLRLSMSYEDYTKLYCGTKFLHDEPLPEALADDPHEIQNRYSVQTALSLRDSGTYQTNIDISALAGYVNRLTQDFEITGNTLIAQMLSQQILALGAAFNGVLRGASLQDMEKMDIERFRNALQAQRQIRQTIALLHSLQQETRRTIEYRPD